MNWSAELVALVPPGVVTVTSTVPAAPAGLVAVTWPALSTLNEAALPPKLTSVAPVKSVPAMVTEVPPAVDPLLGETPLTTGAGGGGVT